MELATPYSIYIHIPFCRARCTYCAFNTYTDRNELIADYVQAVVQELRYLRNKSRQVHTVYFGGGTPSLLSAQQIETILSAVNDFFAVSPQFEVTLEANPGTVDFEKLQAFRAAGVTRLSLGMQSANQGELQLFGRQHDLLAVKEAVQAARQAGFDNLSLDLIYGVPNQTLAMWRASLEEALSLAPDHLSLYALSLESGTELARQVKYHELPLPDSDLAADMYEIATTRLDEAGFIQYEISNWSLPGKACRHNIQYWRNLPYLGIGAGAHGYANQTRTVNVMRPEHYIERLQAAEAEILPFPQTPATMKVENLEREVDMGETLFLGLRLLDEGLSLATFAQRYQERVEDLFGDEVAKLVKQGLLVQKQDRLYLTRPARLISNYVFQHFLAYEP